MKLSDHVLNRPRVRISKLAFLVAATLAGGCVSLDKPTAVKACAGSPQGCSDNPTPPEPDASLR